MHWSGQSESHTKALASAISVQRLKMKPGATAFPLCANLSAMALAASCMKNLRSPITANGEAVRGSRRERHLASSQSVNLAPAAVRLLDDGWTVVTADGLPSAHFEHTVLITKDEPEILTWRAKTQLK